MTVLQRLDAVLEPTKQAVLDMGDALDEMGIADQRVALRQAAGQAFYNTSKFTLHDLRARASRQQLRADFEDYLDGFSPNVQDILDNFEFRNQIPRLSKADAMGSLIEKLTSPDINLSPVPVMDTGGTVRHPGLDNHGMGTVFEELIRRFNEENNEEAGEHFTPRDAVKLMAHLASFLFMLAAPVIRLGHRPRATPPLGQGCWRMRAALATPHSLHPYSRRLAGDPMTARRTLASLHRFSLRVVVLSVPPPVAKVIGPGSHGSFPC